MPLSLVPVAASAATFRELAQNRGIQYGCAVSRAAFADTGSLRLIRENCSIVVPENDMKFGAIEPKQGQFRWERADSLVALSKQNNLVMRGHCLVWHDANPEWLTKGTFNRQQMLALLKNHIDSLVGRYRGKIVAWDVVNEAVADLPWAIPDPTDTLARASFPLRPSFWQQRIGSDYIDSAFVYAHRADPGAVLFYNDYLGEDMWQKSNAIYDMVAGMKKRGIPVGGVGFQCHFAQEGIPVNAMDQNIKRLGALGLKVAITELDIRLRTPATESALISQARYYKEIFRVVLANKAICSQVLTWGISDRNSWIPGFYPGTGAALLFDSLYKPKPAFDSIVALLQDKPLLKKGRIIQKKKTGPFILLGPNPSVKNFGLLADTASPADSSVPRISGTINCSYLIPNWFAAISMGIDSGRGIMDISRYDTLLLKYRSSRNDVRIALTFSSKNTKELFSEFAIPVDTAATEALVPLRYFVDQGLDVTQVSAIRITIVGRPGKGRLSIDALSLR